MKHQILSNCYKKRSLVFPCFACVLLSSIVCGCTPFMPIREEPIIEATITGWEQQDSVGTIKVHEETNLNHADSVRLGLIQGGV